LPEGRIYFIVFCIEKVINIFFFYCCEEISYESHKKVLTANFKGYFVFHPHGKLKKIQQIISECG
jgi:hypothetical protein